MVTRSLQLGMLAILGALLLQSQWVAAQNPAAQAAGTEANRWQSVAPAEIAHSKPHRQ